MFEVRQRRSPACVLPGAQRVRPRPNASVVRVGLVPAMSLAYASRSALREAQQANVTLCLEPEGVVG